MISIPAFAFGDKIVSDKDIDLHAWAIAQFRGEWDENSAVVINLLKYSEWCNLRQRKWPVKYTVIRREVIVIKDVY